MGDLELSLDDIIKRKSTKTGAKWGRNNGGNLKKSPRRLSDSNRKMARTQNPPSNKNMRSSSLKGTRGQGHSAIGDARLKIIQKQRQRMTDAREKLSQIAQKSDARLRLIKLREKKRETLVRGRPPISARLPERQILQRTVQPTYKEELMDYIQDPSYYTRSLPEMPVLNKLYPLPSMPGTLPVIFKTVENNVPPLIIEPEKNIYSWKNPLYVTPTEPIRNVPVIRGSAKMTVGTGRIEDRRESKLASWELDDTPIVITKNIKPQETVGILKRSSSNNIHDGHGIQIIKESPPPIKAGPTKTLSERFCHDGNSAQKITLLKAKLEASQKSSKNGLSESQGSVGHRIVVSNLVPSVTHEDVKELFEDIGELISSKVVRPGTAEVVYKLHKDAVKAVDVYHNRQLDGQPMKCLLVNNRLSVDKGVKPVVEVDLTAFRKALHKKSSS